MKVKIKVEKDVDVITLLVNANVRYWEDANINGEEANEDGSDVPCKNGDLWSPEIDIETGKINNWTQGVYADIHFKVCDQCGWALKDNSGNIILENEDYVPNTLCPDGGGYGDYIIMKISKEGFIENWSFDIDDFITE